MTTPPGYCTLAEALQRLGIGRKNFYQSGLARVLRPAYQAGRTGLYSAQDVGEWADWLDYRRAMITMNVWPTNTPLVPADADGPPWIASEYTFQCPVCGGSAYSPPMNLARLWCPTDGEIDEESI